MANEYDFSDGGIDKASLDIIISDSDIHAPVGEASLDQAFSEISHKTVAVTSLSACPGNYGGRTYLLLCTPITARPNVLDRRSIFFCSPARL